MVLIVGAGRMGQELICRLAWQWATREAFDRPISDSSIAQMGAPANPEVGQTDPSSKVIIILVDREARRKAEAIRNSFPRIVQSCELIEQEMDVKWPEFQRFNWLCHRGRLPRSVYVCLDDNSLGLQTGLKLHTALKNCRPTIVVRMSDDTGFTSLLRAVGSSAGSFHSDEPCPTGVEEHLGENRPYRLASQIASSPRPFLSDDRSGMNIQAFSLLNNCWHPGMFKSGLVETLARGLHEEYVRYHRRNSGCAPNSAEVLTGGANYPVLPPWEDLDHTLKESNRRQPEDIHRKLAAIRCELEVMTSWEHAFFSFGPEEIDRLAVMEHERWRQDLIARGYGVGPKDHAARTHPWLVAWGDLPKDAGSQQAYDQETASAARGIRLPDPES